MAKKLTKIGDEWGLTLDDQMLHDLHINPDTWLEVLPHEQSIMISPAPIEGDATKDPILDKINRRYRHMFIRMAW